LSGNKIAGKEKRLKEFTALAAVALERLLYMSTFDSTIREKDALSQLDPTFLKVIQSFAPDVSFTEDTVAAAMDLHDKIDASRTLLELIAKGLIAAHRQGDEFIYEKLA
jgi:hypothetical protein